MLFCGTIAISLFFFFFLAFGFWLCVLFWGFPDGSDSKESAFSAGDPGSVPDLERFPGEEMATHSSILAWKIPWTEEPDRLQSIG